MNPRSAPPRHYVTADSTPPTRTRGRWWLPGIHWMLLGLTACGAGGASGSCGSCDQSGSTGASVSSSYALHEWGVVSVGQTFTELATGPGLRRGEPGAFRRGGGNGFDPEQAVEKPVVYVHADGPVDFTLTIGTGPGYEIAERWPEQGSALSWSARASGQPCTQPSAYPTGCTSIDGYCETLELASYTTDDSSCLVMGDVNASLIFYRLRAATGQARASLPVQVHAAANDGHGSSNVFEVSAQSPRVAWRVRHDAGGRALVQRFEIGTGPSIVPGANSPDAASAAAWTSAELEARGLTQSEIGAFQNAWWQELFRVEPTVSLRTGESAGGAREGIAEETPVRVSEDEEAVPPSPTLIRDMFIYFLTSEEIDSIARLDASPTPSATHRAFMVRHYLD